MVKIVSQKPLGKYTVLLIEGSLPKTKYTKYKIDGKEYDIVPVSDMKNTIAVQTKDNLVGKTVEFV